MPRGNNLVVLDGNLAADPEVRYTGSGTPMGTLRLATNTESRKKPDGTYEALPQFQCKKTGAGHFSPPLLDAVPERPIVNLATGPS